MHVRVCAVARIIRGSVIFSSTSVTELSAQRGQFLHGALGLITLSRGGLLRSIHGNRLCRAACAEGAPCSSQGGASWGGEFQAKAGCGCDCCGAHGSTAMETPGLSAGPPWCGPPRRAPVWVEGWRPKVGFPAVLKPVSGAASLGVKKVIDMDDLRATCPLHGNRTPRRASIAKPREEPERTERRDDLSEIGAYCKLRDTIFETRHTMDEAE